MVQRPNARLRLLLRQGLGLLLASSSAALVAACGDDPPPAYLIRDERVLAIRADPPEALPGEQVTLTPLVVGPNGTLEPEDYEATWWRCPMSESDGRADEERCSSPDARVALGEGVPLVERVDPALLPLPDEGDSAAVSDEKLLNATLGYWRSYGLTMAAAGGRVVDAFKRVVVFATPEPLAEVDPRLATLDVRVNDAGELEQNQNPQLTGVRVRETGRDGEVVTTLKAGGSYWLEPDYDASSLQTYYALEIELEGLGLDDPASLRQLSGEELLGRLEKVRRCEVPVFSWFITGGLLQESVSVDESVVTGEFKSRGVSCPAVEGAARRPEVLFTAPTGDEIPSDGIVHAWLVMRDGRGGTAYTSFDLSIER